MSIIKFDDSYEAFDEDYEESPSNIFEEGEKDEESLSEKILENFVGDAKALARYYIEVWFQGMKVPVQLLHSEVRISAVLNTSICKCADKAYAAFGEKYIASETQGVSEDIKIMCSLLDEIRVKKIPKCFAGGIILMHLELVRGLEIDYE